MVQKADQIQVDLRRAILGGAIAALVTLAGSWWVGHISGGEARVLVEASLPRMRSFCNTIILSSATILALMLTILGMSSQASSELTAHHYQRIRQIALFDAILIVGTATVLLVFNVPITESENVPTVWFATLYYVILACTSLIGGALVSVVLMIHHTISDIIDVIGLGRTDKEVVAKENSTDESPRAEEKQDAG